MMSLASRQGVAQRLRGQGRRVLKEKKRTVGTTGDKNA